MVDISALLCKDKRQYLLTLEVIRYCVFVLQGRAVNSGFRQLCRQRSALLCVNCTNTTYVTKPWWTGRIQNLDHNSVGLPQFVFI